MKIAAVVVTYNRKELLKECLDAILKQSHKVDEVIVIDNNSTDNTYEELKKNGYIKNQFIKYVKLEKNIGGAGGFYEGMKIAYGENYDWVWIMDDDTIPDKTCLEKLINSFDKINDNKISFLASTVYGENGEAMNVPQIDTDAEENGYQGWYRYLENGIVRIKEATFVSLLINVQAIKKCGLPIRDYFIWGDDTEYTRRITKFFGKAYFIGESKVLHKRKNARNLTIINEENTNRMRNYYYMIRNNLINAKLYRGKKGVIKTLLEDVILSFKVLFKKNKCKTKKFFTIYKGIFAYIFRIYDTKEVKNRFKI